MNKAYIRTDQELGIWSEFWEIKCFGQCCAFVVMVGATILIATKCEGQLDEFLMMEAPWKYRQKEDDSENFELKSFN